MAILHIAWRELRALFSTAIGWMVLCGFLSITGVLWFIWLAEYADQQAKMAFNPYGGASLSVTEALLIPWFGNCALILIFMAPALSMRMFAEEYKQRTMELLFTSPISTLEIVLGKYLGTVCFAVVMLLCTAHVPATLYYWGQPEFGAVAGSYLATFLLASLIIAMGMFCSSMTTNQVVALSMSFAASLVLWVAAFAGSDPDALLSHIGLTTHLQEMYGGSVRLSDLVYFGTGILVFIFATHQRLESHRWS